MSVAYCEWMRFFIKNFQACVGLPVLDEVVDGERNTFDGVLQIGVGDGRVVDVDRRTRARLLQDPELAHRHRLRQLHLTSLPNQTVWNELNKVSSKISTNYKQEFQS